MNAYLQSTIMASTFTAIMRLAKCSVEVRPDGMSQADFERSVALEVAKQATSLANLDDVSLDIIRNVLVKP